MTRKGIPQEKRKPTLSPEQKRVPLSTTLAASTIRGADLIAGAKGLNGKGRVFDYLVEKELDELLGK